MARCKYLYEQRLVPNSCTTEDIAQLKHSRNAVATHHHQSQLVKVLLVGMEKAGKTTWCRYVTSQEEENQRMLNEYEPTMRANFVRSSASFSIDNAQNVYTFGFWDTAGRERFDSVSFSAVHIGTYMRNSSIVLLMIPLDGSAQYSIQWIEHILRHPCFTPEMKCLVIGTKSDLKRDNRLSYDLLSHCTRCKIPYYECDLTDPDQAFRVLYAMIHYGLRDYNQPTTR